MAPHGNVFIGCCLKSGFCKLSEGSSSSVVSSDLVQKHKMPAYGLNVDKCNTMRNMKMSCERGFDKHIQGDLFFSYHICSILPCNRAAIVGLNENIDFLAKQISAIFSMLLFI